MKALLVGDIHANAAWMATVVRPVAERLSVDAVIQVGDFGYWPDAYAVELAAGFPVPFMFLDGNHEHHPLLAGSLEAAGADLSAPVQVDGSLWYLPRGSRWVWDGVRLGALGGAASIDRAARIPGKSWFPEELISSSDMERHAQAGLCNVLFTHDAPMAVNLPLRPRWELNRVWQAELETCDQQRLLLDQALDSARCEILVHGHYHLRARSRVFRSWGEVDVVSLAEDDTDVTGNMALLVCEAGIAEVKELWVPPPKGRGRFDLSALEVL